MSRKLVCLIIVVGIGMLLHNKSLVIAQDSRTEVQFGSSPLGANIFIDNERVGTTPLTLMMEPGVYDVRLSLQGFNNWKQTVAVFGDRQTIHGQLADGPRFIKLGWRPVNPKWSYDGSLLRFDTGNQDNRFYVYHIEDGTIELNQPALNLIQDENIVRSLNLPVDDSFYSVAFSSPSGRYIVYTTPMETSSETYPAITIFDTETNLSQQSHVGVFDGGIPLLLPPFRIDWAPDERSFRVDKPSNNLFEEFILIDDDNLKVVSIRSLKDLESITLDDQSIFLSRVADMGNDKRALVYYGGNPATGDQGLYLVDLTEEPIDITTYPARRINLPFVIGAAFLNDNPDKVLVAFEEGIGIYDLTTDFVTLIDSTIKPSWGVYDVVFSPDLKYALIYADPSSYWLYEMPELEDVMRE